MEASLIMEKPRKSELPFQDATRYQKGYLPISWAGGVNRKQTHFQATAQDRESALPRNSWWAEI